MTKTTKTLLVLTAVNLIAGLVFATNLVNVHEAVWLYVAMPAGAICLGLFLISKLLEKEIARYDAEQQNILNAATRPPERQASSAPSAGHHTLAKAH